MMAIGKIGQPLNLALSRFSAKLLLLVIGKYFNYRTFFRAIGYPKGPSAGDLIGSQNLNMEVSKT